MTPLGFFFFVGGESMWGGGGLAQCGSGPRSLYDSHSGSVNRSVGLRIQCMARSFHLRRGRGNHGPGASALPQRRVGAECSGGSASEGECVAVWVFVGNGFSEALEACRG